MCKYLKVSFDLIKKEKERYLKECDFNETQEKVFLDLTDKKHLDRLQIALKEHLSIDCVDRIIRQIKNKMLKII